MVGRLVNTFRNSIIQQAPKPKPAGAEKRISLAPSRAEKRPVDKPAHQSVKAMRQQTQRAASSSGKRETASLDKRTCRPLILPDYETEAIRPLTKIRALIDGDPKSIAEFSNVRTEVIERFIVDITDKDRENGFVPHENQVVHHVSIPRKDIPDAANTFKDSPDDPVEMFAKLDRQGTGKFAKLAMNEDVAKLWELFDAKDQTFSQACAALSTIPESLASDAKEWKTAGDAGASKWLETTDGIPKSVADCALVLNQEDFIKQCPKDVQDQVRKLGAHYKNLLGSLMDKDGVFQTSRAHALVTARSIELRKIGVEPEPVTKALPEKTKIGIFFGKLRNNWRGGVRPAKESRLGTKTLYLFRLEEKYGESDKLDEIRTFLRDPKVKITDKQVSNLQNQLKKESEPES